MQRVLIVGTGLIGASVGLALKAAGFKGSVLGWDADGSELVEAKRVGAVDEALPNRESVLEAKADVTLLATTVMAIMDWMQRLAPGLSEGQLVTDVGSTKRDISLLAKGLYNRPGQARFLPGHPMAGKESGGAGLAEAGLFQGASWIFTPVAEKTAVEVEWMQQVAGFGAAVREMDFVRHDEVLAWVSHLPQMVSTALAALLEDELGVDSEGVSAIGGRALRETTRLGASPYSMWRDVAMSNTEAISLSLLGLEQRLAHLRENLRTPELRAEFAKANRFRDTFGPK